MQPFLSRTIQTSFQNIHRNKILSVAILMVMTIALLVFQLTIATNLITDTAISIVHKQIDLAVDLRPGVQDFQVQQTISAIKKLDAVRDAVYIPKEVALENFRQQYAEIAGFLDEYGIENPLPNTIFILTNSPAEHTSILNFLEQDIYKDIVDTESAMNKIQARTRTNRLVEVTDAVRQLALFLTSLLLILGIFTIWNTIRIAMHARQEERQIMTLVGASPGFMKAPYLWEGFWFGLVSAALATFLTGLIISLISHKASLYLANEPLLFTPFWSSVFPDIHLNLSQFFAGNWLRLLGLTALVGIIISTLSAWIATFGSHKR